MKLPRLCLVAGGAIERLKRQGVEPDLDDIIALHELGKRLENPKGQASLCVTGNPVRVGNATLWPLSIGAERWLNGKALDWFDGDSAVSLYAVAFAYAMSKTPEVLQELVTAKQAIEAVNDWANQCGATQDEISDAIEQLLPEEKPPGKNDKVCPECLQAMPPEGPREDPELLPAEPDEPQYFEMIEKLLKYFPGTTYDYWIWTPPAAVSFRLLNAAIMNNAEGVTETANSPHMQATHRFETAVRLIAEKHAKRKERAESEAQ